MAILDLAPARARAATPWLAALLALAVWSGMALADPAKFFGRFSGSAVVQTRDGADIPRDMSVRIEGAEDGFVVEWTSVTYRADGTTKEKTHEIRFVETARAGVYSAAQKRNMFGHLSPLDPMKGEPYAWARIVDDTITVYSLFVDEDGGYSLQQYDRTLVDGGMNLRFQRVTNGEILRAVETFLARDG